MSKRARALVFGAMLAAMNLAGLTAVTQAQTSDAPASNQDARRPPIERQVGESYRNYHEALAARAQTAQDDAVERFRRGERASQEQPATADPTQQELADRWNDYYYQATRMSRAQDKAWMPAWQRADNPTSPPAQVPAPAPGEPNGQSGWLLASLGVLTVVLALVGGLAVLAARRASRRARLGHAA